MKISASEYLEKWKDEEHLLVDIRDYLDIQKQGKLERAMLSSFDEIVEHMEMIPTFVPCFGVCNDGSLSKNLAEYLRENNFDNVFYIEGGAEILLGVLN